MQLQRERNVLVFHVVSPGHVMLPLDQGRLITDVVPDGIRKTASLPHLNSGLFLDCLKELVLVDFAIKLPKDLLALVVPWFREPIARYLLKFIVLIWRSRQVRLFEADVLLHEDSWAGCLEIWASFWIFRQFFENDLGKSVWHLNRMSVIVSRAYILEFRSSRSLPLWNACQRL